MQRTDESDFGVTWLMSMFHQDWSHHGPTAAAAVQYHFWEGLDQESVLAVRQDARLLQSLPSDTIEALWQAGTATGPDFFSGGRTGVTSGAQWTETLIGLCDVWLSAKRHVRPLDGPTGVQDGADGADVADEVLTEIRRARLVPGTVGHALAECARRCTPDLAFRLLLRAMSEAGAEAQASLSLEQYARLETLGAVLQYGEFVVESVGYLVAEG